MNRTAIIFDIDGTLLKSEHLDAKFFVQAVRDVAGDVYIADDWSCYKKVTDIGIITEILLQNGKTDIPGYIAAIRMRFGELLDVHFKSGGECTPVRGSAEFLTSIAANPAYTIGIATGGWHHSARMKLGIAGIDVSAIPMSTSDDGDDRTEIMLHCLGRMPPTPKRIVYIGDGSWDRDASSELGWHFIGIGPKLRHRCDCWFSDFSDIEAILRCINSDTNDNRQA